ncbi:hypothetical protein MKX03_005607 [Papaver bracteatum]|nr:hypothetical protein MKX03_005607 [Papaver bracteatum]
MVADKSPEQVKDIVETFATSSADDWINVDKVPHFFLGILYGAFLCLGGFLSFMLKESNSVIRFGFERGSSGCMVAFFIYKIVLDDKLKKGIA